MCHDASQGAGRIPGDAALQALSPLMSETLEGVAPEQDIYWIFFSAISWAAQLK